MAKKAGLFALASLALFANSPPLQACTGIRISAKDGSEVHGRTAEFGINLDLSLLAIPAGYEFQGAAPKGKGMPYKAKYAAVGAMTFDNPLLLDGMNEKGLSVGAFYFPGYASYATITPENQSKALSPLDFPNWLVTNFATVDEVKQALPGVVIAPTPIPNWGPDAPPMHYIVYDKEGKSLVIEPLNGKLVTYDNPLGVITNSPTFDWHLTNLRNYIALTPYPAKPIAVEDLKLSSFGQGSGMIGLPGDFTPPSRFVRATAFSSTAVPSKSNIEAVPQAFHILNQFDIPLGAVRESAKPNAPMDSTIGTVVRDPKSLKYYVRTYADQTIRGVDLKQVTANSKSLKRLSLSGYQQPMVDMSAELNKATSSK